MSSINLQKTFRFYYWLIIEFFKKHIKVITVSILLSFIIILSLISVVPYLTALIFTEKQIIGLVGNYAINSLPEEILAKISNPLVFVNEKGDIVPALASSWEQIDGGRQYRFHLRKNLLWSDGKLFNSHDINYSFKDVQRKAVDDNTINFYLKKPLSIFPNYLTKPIIRYPLKGVGGVYKVEKLKAEEGYVRELLLEPNKKGFPFLIYRFYENENGLINAYKLGLIREMIVDKKTLADSLADWKNTDMERIVNYSRVMTVFFNLNKPLLKNKEVREAIAVAIPKDFITQSGEPAAGPIPPTSWAFNSDLKKTIYDPDMAKNLLNKFIEATRPAKLTLSTYYEFFNFADIIKEALENVGFKVNIKFLSPGETSDFDLLFAFWKVPSDPDQYFFWHSTQTEGNLTHYKNLKVDKLLEDGRTTFSIKERKKLYNEFQRILVEEKPADFLYFPYLYKIRRRN